MHGVDQPPVHRLQPVAHIRQRARHDGGQRVGEIALGQRVGQTRVLDMADEIIRHSAAPISAASAATRSYSIWRAAGSGRCCWPNASRARKWPVSAQPVAPVRRLPLRCRPPGSAAAAAAVRPHAGRRRGHRAAGLRRDVGQPGGLPGHRAARQIEAVAEVGEQHRLPAHQVGQHRRALRQVRDQVQQARTRADAARVPAARPPPRRRPRTASPAPAHRPSPERRRDAPVRREAAELIGQPRDPAHLHEVARLPDRRLRPRDAPPRARPRCAPCSAVITVAMASPSPYGRASSTMAGASHSMM